MKRVAMTLLSDSGLQRNKRKVALNDIEAIAELYKINGYTPEILYTDDLKAKSDLNEYDTLFIFYGGVILFGGKQSPYLVHLIEMINSFKRNVVIFANDVMDKVVNRNDKPGFVSINRPVYYASPTGSGGSDSETSDFEILADLEINQSFIIGKRLAELPPVEQQPEFKIIYGGRNRPAMVKRLNALSKRFSFLAYSKIAQALPKATEFKMDTLLNNAELRVLNSFGEYSLMLHEKKKEYFTTRVFEQLLSNSLVMFDRDWEVYMPFWNEWNTFGSMDELIEKIDQPYSKVRLQEQHEMVRSFDFDREIEKQAKALKEVIE